MAQAPHCAHFRARRATDAITVLRVLLLLASAESGAANVRRTLNHSLDGSWLGHPSELETVYKSPEMQTGPSATKGNYYFDVVHRHLSRFRGTNVVICEIGINAGGSLKLWRHYLGPRATVCGIDVFNASYMLGNPEYGSPDLIINGAQLGHMWTPDYWARLRKIVPHLDVLVDDGGHTQALQRASLDFGVPFLAPGGVYILEDIVDDMRRGSVVYQAASRYIGIKSSMMPASAPAPAPASVPARSPVETTAQQDQGSSESDGSVAQSVSNATHSGFYKYKGVKGVTDEFSTTFGVSFYPMMIVVEKMTQPRGVNRAIEIGTVFKTGKRPIGTKGGGR